MMRSILTHCARRRPMEAAPAQWRRVRPAPSVVAMPRSPAATPGPSSPLGPESLQYEAQSRLLAEGKKLCPEEEAKRQKFPLDRWDELAARAANEEYPKGVDVLM